MSNYTQSFNALMEQFIEEIEKVYPEEKGIGIYKNSFYLFKKMNTSKPSQLYYNSIYMFEQQVLNKDESVLNQNIEIINDLNIKYWWNTSTAETKDAVWQYLQALLQLSKMINQ